MSPAAYRAPRPDEAVLGRMPGAVAEPSSIEEAAAVVAETSRDGRSLLFVGGGTDLETGGVPESLDVLLSTRRLDRIVEHAPSDQIAVVEAGVTLASLAATLAAQGQRLALDPPLPERATVGGVVAANAFGPRRARYGAARDLLIGVTLVRADGRLARGGGKVVKNVAGFDMPRLMAGSLGTLGLIATATFRLHPLPESSATLAVPGVAPGPLRALCGRVRDAQLEPDSVVAFRAGEGLFDLAVRFEGFRPSVTAQRDRLAKLCADASRRVEALDDASARVLWARHDAARRQGGLRVKIAALPSDLERVERDVFAPLARTLGDGAAVWYPTLGLGFAGGAPADAARSAAAVESARRALTEGGGSLVLLAAPDAVRASADPWGAAPPALPLLRAVKLRLDPGRRLAPGRFVEGSSERGRAPAPRGRPLHDECVHCGFCLPACPTWHSWSEEMDSPRGRIDLMRGLAEGRFAWSDAVARHFDRCLGCLGCVTACPSGVRYDVLIEQTRAVREKAHPRSAADRLFRETLFAVLPYPARLRAAAVFAGFYEKSGLRALVRKSGALRLLPKRVAALEALMPSSAAAPDLPERVPAAGAPRARVALVTGCVQSVFFPGINAATARVLAAEGCDVVVPADQGCCGALSIHAGREEESLGFARALIEKFEGGGYDAILINAAGCGSHLKDYGRLLSGDPAWARRASEFRARVKDVTEFLAGLPPRAARHPIPARVAYHDACHLAHGQGIRQPPRALLSGIPGVTVVEIADGDQCCGSAGIYNLVEPESADEIGERKIGHVLAAEADVLASANPGCLLQIGKHARRRGARLPAYHPIEILDASIAGRSLPRDS